MKMEERTEVPLAMTEFKEQEDTHRRNRDDRASEKAAWSMDGRSWKVQEAGCAERAVLWMMLRRRRW